MSSKVPEGITSEMLESLVKNPGQTLSNGPTNHYKPTASVPLRGEKDLRPNIKGQEGVEVVLRPNMDKNNAQREREEALLRADREKATKELRDIQDALEPKKLLATINALSRKVNRLEKQVKELNG